MLDIILKIEVTASATAAGTAAVTSRLATPRRHPTVCTMHPRVNQLSHYVTITTEVQLQPALRCDAAQCK